MKIKIKVEHLPLHFLILAGFLVLYAVFHLITWQSVILNSVLFVVGVLMLTTHQALLINTDKKEYSEYYWMLGVKLKNFTERYQEITSVYCTAGNYSQQYGKYNRRFISGIMYKGYIELKDQDKLFVGQNKNKHVLMKKLSKISKQLEVAVEDQIKKINNGFA
jgi:hypothetical protein